MLCINSGEMISWLNQSKVGGVGICVQYVLYVSNLVKCKVRWAGLVCICFNSGEMKSWFTQSKVGGVVFVPEQSTSVNRNTKYRAGHWIMNKTNKEFQELVNVSS